MRWTIGLALVCTAIVADAREAPQPAPGKADCRNPSAQRVLDTQRAGPQRLGQLPDADLIRAVDYREGDCSKPIRIGRTIRR